MNTADRSQPQICTQNIGDTGLSYLLYEGEGPPLILLHATGFQPWLWHPLARELAREYPSAAGTAGQCKKGQRQSSNGYTISSEDPPGGGARSDGIDFEAKGEELYGKGKKGR